MQLPQGDCSLDRQTNINTYGFIIGDILLAQTIILLSEIHTEKKTDDLKRENQSHNT